jgi:hypothetical protein
MHPCAYLLKHVPPLGNFQLAMLIGWEQMCAWINVLMRVATAIFDSLAHQFQWMWIKLTPLNEHMVIQ